MVVNKDGKKECFNCSYDKYSETALMPGFGKLTIKEHDKKDR